MNVLAIDDERLALLSIKEILESVLPNDNIYCFRDVEDAYKEIEDKQIDIAFLDIRMKGYSGIEVALKLKNKYPKINIIFTTGYSTYQTEAFEMHASGYLRKPITKEQVIEELNNLRYEVKKPMPKVFAKTFGNFDFYVDNKPIEFKRSLAKELLAYLIDKEGTYVTRQELSMVLFDDISYDRKRQDYITKIIKSLFDTLKEYGVGDVLVKKYNSYSVDTTKFVCDAYEYFKGNLEAINNYKGQYLSQFVWSDDETLNFYRKLEKTK